MILRELCKVCFETVLVGYHLMQSIGQRCNLTATFCVLVIQFLLSLHRCLFGIVGLLLESQGRLECLQNARTPSVCWRLRVQLRPHKEASCLPQDERLTSFAWVAFLSRSPISFLRESSWALVSAASIERVIARSPDTRVSSSRMSCCRQKTRVSQNAVSR